MTDIRCLVWFRLHLHVACVWNDLHTLLEQLTCSHKCMHHKGCFSHVCDYNILFPLPNRVITMTLYVSSSCTKGSLPGVLWPKKTPFPPISFFLSSLWVPSHSHLPPSALSCFLSAGGEIQMWRQRELDRKRRGREGQRQKSTSIWRQTSLSKTLWTRLLHT